MEREPKWNALKSVRLKKIRGLSFEDILGARYIKTENHPNRDNQKLMLFEHKGKIWVVPFVDAEKERFLKTLYPSRKYTKLYERGAL